MRSWLVLSMAAAGCAASVALVPSVAAAGDDDSVPVIPLPSPVIPDQGRERQDQDLIDLKPPILSPGAEGSTACSPGATITLFGQAYTCPPAAVPVVPAPTPVVQGPVIISPRQPPTAGQSIIEYDLPVTGTILWWFIG
jgi:hypothetical protein